ncbi:MAG: hypothetical protein R6V58_17640 [Planctomycetota bacterium]
MRAVTRWFVIAIAALALPAAAAQPAEPEARLGRMSRSVDYGHLRLDFRMRGKGFSQRCFVLLPLEAASGDDLAEIDLKAFIGKKQHPWFWFAPTLQHRYPNEWHSWYFKRILGAGGVIAGVDVDHSWGNLAGRKLYTHFYRAATERFNLKPRANLLAEGLGGLMAYNWAADHPDKVSSIAGIYPICRIEPSPFFARVYNLAGKDERKLALPELEDHLKENLKQLKEHLKEHNPPDRLKGLVEAGVEIMHIHGGRDRVVPAENHTLPLVLRYRELGGDGDAVILRGERHEPTPMFFESPRFLRFLLRQLKEPDEPAPKTKPEKEDKTGGD